MIRDTHAGPHEFVCGFCGLLCDDLTVVWQGEQLELLGRCERAQRGLQDFWRGQQTAAQPCVGGKSVSLSEALRHAAQQLLAGKRPHFDGLAADVAAQRAVLRLADALGASVAHMNLAAMRRNTAALQARGAFATTFAEVRNRADLLLVVGTDAGSRFPRFFERMLAPTTDGEGAAVPARELIFLGPKFCPADRLPSEIRVHHLPCRDDELFAAIAQLRMALTDGNRSTANPLATQDLQALVERMHAAHYGVVVWVAADLAFPHAELLVEAMTELVKTLNRQQRWAALALAGSDADITANQVAGWQTSNALPVSFAGGHVSYQPLFDAAAEADVLLWLSTFDPVREPPATSAARIVIGHPAMAQPERFVVFIPVGIPGIHHSGQLFRSDAVVALPLHQLTASDLPSAAQVLNQLTQATTALRADTPWP